jgi:23S rRNA (adenine2503-C2)-methyltransferase
MRDLSLAELRNFILGIGEEEFRFRQVSSWLYRKYAQDFNDMTDLSKPLRDTLHSLAAITTIQPIEAKISRSDGTRKILYRLDDGEAIESVLMRQEKRITLCISTQVGCPLNCVFCQTGHGRFKRNLSAGEILDQICLLKRECIDSAEKVNIVFMGMGEPLLNLRELTKAIRTLNDPMGLNTGSKRITVSTSGLPERIVELADEELKCSLAISLNASSDAKRKKLMPALANYSIQDILDAARYFHKKTKRRVTLEYVLLAGINTSKQDATALAKLSAGGPFKINLIPYNPVRNSDFRSMSDEAIDKFVRVLLPTAPAVTVRRSRGIDIDAACGQLWTKSLKETAEPPT